MKKLLLTVLTLMLVLALGADITRADAQASCTASTGNGGDQTNEPWNSSTGGTDPIDMATGAFQVTRTDINLPGPMPITFTRTYTSYGGTAQVLGPNWFDNCHKYLTFGTIGVGYNRGDGVSIPLYCDSHNDIGELSANHAVSKQNPYYTLTSTDLQHFVVSDRFGNSEYYTLAGFYAYITKATDRNGNELDYTHSVDSSGNMGIPVLTVTDPKSGRYIAFSYDPVTAQLTSITDSSGRTVTYSYTSESDGGDYKYLSSVVLPGTPDFPGGTGETYTYDSVNNLATITDGNGNLEVSNVYGVTGMNWNSVLQQTANGGTCTLAYDNTDPTAPKITYTNYKGFVTEYTDDGNRNITKKVVHTTGLHSGVPSGTTYETDYTYGTGATLTVVGGGAPGSPGGGTVVTSDGPGNDSSQPNNCYKIQERDPNGNGTSWTYDQYGNILTQTKNFASGRPVDSTKGTQATSSAITYTYSSQFNEVTSKTDASGTTTYNYDSTTGNLLTITYPTTAAGTATETFTYNSAGQVLTDTTPDGETVNTYDSSGGLTNGYLLSKINDYGSGKLNAETDYTYDSYGNVASIKDPNRNTTTFTYDAQNQLIETDGASGEVDKRNYDGNGQLTIDKKLAPGSTWQETENVYNTNQQLWKTRQYTGTTTYLETDYAYDADSNRISVTDPLGHSVTTTYDERDKPYLVADTLGNKTYYDYDPNGNLIKLTDELSNVTSYAFDGLDRMEQKTFPDGSYQTWKYDAVGNVTSMLTPAGNTVTQTYDSRNRMLTQNYTAASGPSTITNVYDIMGRVSTSTEGGTALSYGYDALGRNTSFTDQAGRNSSYTYDLDGHRLSATYPTGIKVQRVYDSSSRLWKLQDTTATTLATYTYDTLDRVSGVALANGTSVAYGYDLANRLGSLNNTLDGTTRNYSYVYDDDSRVISTTEPRGTIGSSYSDRNEVKGITEPTGSPFADQAFAYDAGFNRSSWTLGSSTTSYTVNNLNQYSTVSGLTAPTWNTDGGLHTFAGNTYIYDALQRLTEVDYSGGKTIFSYDPLGRRVKKVDENASGAAISTFQYHYDGSEVAVEYQPSTTWTYYLGLGLDQVVLRDSGSAKQWYYRDGHGSTSTVTDNSGNVLEQYEYNAQGQFQIANGSGSVESTTQIANDILYTGREYDDETGNYFYRARYYNPQLGRFISRDPLSGAEFSQGTNLYAYCSNNFLNASDPTGKCWKQMLQDLSNFMNGVTSMVNAALGDTTLNNSPGPVAPADATFFASFQTSAFAGGGGTGSVGGYISTDGNMGLYYQTGLGAGADIGPLQGVVGVTATDTSGFMGPYNNINGSAQIGSGSLLFDPDTNALLGGSLSFGPSIGPGSVTQTNTVPFPGMQYNMWGSNSSAGTGF